MKFTLNEEDDKIITDWIEEDKRSRRLAENRHSYHFYSYLDNCIFSVDSSSFRAEYEYWRDHE